MSTLALTLTILIINTVAAACCLVYSLISRNGLRAMSALIMLVVPVVGALLFGMSFLVVKLVLSKNKADLDDVSFSSDRVGPIQMPNYAEEVMTVPLEEALIASNDDDRRRSLLNKLKTSYDNNIPMIMQAVENEDAETAHYASSVIMNVTSSYMGNIKQLAYELEKTPRDLEINRTYADYVFEFICSGILSPLERRKYVYLYLSLMKTIYDIDVGRLSAADYKNIIDFNLEYLDSYDVLKWCEACMIQYPSEEISYLNKLKFYYRLELTHEFMDTLKELKASSIFLTDKGLDLIRFFSNSLGLNAIKKA